MRVMTSLLFSGPTSTVSAATTLSASAASIFCTTAPSMLVRMLVYTRLSCCIAARLVREQLDRTLDQQARHSPSPKRCRAQSPEHAMVNALTTFALLLYEPISIRHLPHGCLGIPSTSLMSS